MSWSQRWRGVFDEAAPQVGRRLAQGRAYQRSGRVTELRVRPGVLSGRVQGSRATPYLVEVGAPPLSPSQWDAVIAAIAAQVRHSARLLASQPPEGLEAELEPIGIRLFPEAADLSVACPCDDGVVPCAHAAALWEAVARDLDDDPFLLLRFRGRGRQRLLADVAAARRRSGARPSPDSVPLTALDPHGWSRARAPLDGVELPPAGGTAAASPLRLLGDPPGWRGGVGADALFGPLIERGAAAARRLLRGGDPSPDADEPSRDADRDDPSRDEPRPPTR